MGAALAAHVSKLAGALERVAISKAVVNTSSGDLSPEENEGIIQVLQNLAESLKCGPSQYFIHR